MREEGQGSEVGDDITTVPNPLRAILPTRDKGERGVTSKGRKRKALDRNEFVRAPRLMIAGRRTRGQEKVKASVIEVLLSVRPQEGHS